MSYWSSETWVTFTMKSGSKGIFSPYHPEEIVCLSQSILCFKMHGQTLLSSPITRAGKLLTWAGSAKFSASVKKSRCDG